MAESKKSFVLYCDLIHTVEHLPNDKAGELFKHILSYVNDRDPVTDCIVVKLAFEPIRQQLKRDLSKWDEIKEKRRIAGLASAEAKRLAAEQALTNSTHVESVEQTSTNSTVSVNVNGNVNGNVNDKKRKEGVTAQPPHPLIAWIAKNAPRVQQLKQPLTNEEAQRIMDDLAIDSENKKQRLRDLLISMENYKPLLTKSVSANLTIRKWWKSELERTGEVAKATVTPIKMNTETYSR